MKPKNTVFRLRRPTRPGARKISGGDVLCPGKQTTLKQPGCKIYLVGGFFFDFHPYLVKWSSMTNIFRIGSLKPPTRYTCIHLNIAIWFICILYTSFFLRFIYIHCFFHFNPWKNLQTHLEFASNRRIAFRNFSKSLAVQLQLGMFWSNTEAVDSKDDGFLLWNSVRKNWGFLDFGYY